MINIAIAEDQILFRKGMIALLSTFKNMRVCLESENGSDFLQQLKVSKDAIDVALIDINMPEINGIELLRVMRSSFPKIKNIILTIHEEEKYIHKLIEEGANAYLIKNSDPREVEKAIHTVVSHDYYFNERSIKAMHNQMCIYNS